MAENKYPTFKISNQRKLVTAVFLFCLGCVFAFVNLVLEWMNVAVFT